MKGERIKRKTGRLMCLVSFRLSRERRRDDIRSREKKKNKKKGQRVLPFDQTFINKWRRGDRK